MMKEKYYLAPGKVIGNPELSGGKLEAKKDYVELSEKEFEIIKESIPFLSATGVIVPSSKLAEVKSADSSTETKSEKRLALEKEATELEIEFTDKTSQKELQALIDKALEDSGKGDDK